MRVTRTVVSLFVFWFAALTIICAAAAPRMVFTPRHHTSLLTAMR